MITISVRTMIRICLLPVLAGMLVFLFCTDDFGISPMPGKLVARVIFRGTPPENTEGVYLNVAPEFPPHAINELYHSPNSLPLDQDTVITELALPFGHFDAVSLWWYNKTTQSNLADILFLLLDPQNSLLPQGFDLSPAHPVHTVELYPNWNRVDRNATIQGKIWFNGPFPEDTWVTAIAAYAFEPVVDVHFLVWLKSIDFSVGTDSRNYNAAENSYTFELPVRHGSVEYLAVFWLRERSGLTDYVTVGIYEDPENPGDPAIISLKEGETSPFITIHADWGKIGSSP